MTFFHSRRSKFWGLMWFKSKSESLLLLRDFHFCRLRPAKPPNTTRPQEKQPTSPAALKPAKEQTNKSPNDKHMASFYGGTSRTPPPPPPLQTPPPALSTLSGSAPGGGPLGVRTTGPFKKRADAHSARALFSNPLVTSSPAACFLSAATPSVCDLERSWTVSQSSSSLFIASLVDFYKRRGGGRR